MRTLFVLIALALFPADAAQADCRAEYKAKRDNPLKLFHDVVRISGPCTRANAAMQLQRQLAAQEITLLKVISLRNE